MIITVNDTQRCLKSDTALTSVMPIKMYLEVQLNEVPSVVQIVCEVCSCHIKFDHEHLFRISIRML